MGSKNNQLSQKIAMFKRWAKILGGKTAVAVEQGPSKYFSTTEIAGYYNDLTGKVSSNTLLDDNGIPLPVTAGGDKTHFPTAIFQYGLGCYDLYLGNADKQMLCRFMRCAAWALDAKRADGSWDAFGAIGSMRYGISSMVQGEGASVLLRAYSQTDDVRYLLVAKQAIDFMLQPFEKGGPAFYIGDDLFLEEYPQIPHRSVLNGWIFSLFGIYDLNLIDTWYKAIFYKTTQTLSVYLSHYDAGFWSYYDLEKRIASPAYHKLHIALLQVMAKLTGNCVFLQAAQKFANYQLNPINRLRAIIIKIVQKLY